MRLFAALLPPPAAVAELAAALDALPAPPGADRPRWTHRADWHVTLVFYGEVPAPVRPALERRLARAAADARPPTVRVAGAGRFGERVLWAGVATGDGRLAELAAAASAVGRESGLPMDDRPFRAHLTLARSAPGGTQGARGTGGVAPYVDALAAFRGTPWTAGELALVRSLPVDGGDVPGGRPRYRTAAAWRLGG
ncbi:RNA 2',3'-cyclic phosphodiesterase [Streptomyces phytohabitans]|uniref:RNA 2',3'-cyclic phosphodiesterase n=1 Tax=Streptomyces phytohabitans TaxID=1150371 RepID=UPI00345B8D67